LTVFDEQAHIRNSERIGDKEQAGTGNRIDNEEEIGAMSEWMTENRSETPQNR
jgi:hypothetical protein